MAERKATNKYYPPDYDPRKGSLNAFVGSHPLRERARKLDQGILIVRFEMPFNVWCAGCNNHIGRGVRYNAEKKQAGSYFSTKIWNFRMKCHLCDNYIEVNTDPKNSDYVIVAGASRKVETWEADEEETGTIRLADEEEAKRLAEDPFYRLEHASEDQRKAKATAPILERLQDLRSGYEDDYDNNQRLRSSFRVSFLSSFFFLHCFIHLLPFSYLTFSPTETQERDCKFRERG
ncbi:Protein saf4 [Balamuthia mandrillaris]